MIKYSGSGVLTKISQLIKSKFDSLATVAITGSYKDLLDRPNIGTVVRDSIILNSDSTTINIPFEIQDTSSLCVYHNGLLLISGTHYNATTTTITLNNYTAKSGDTITFIGSIDPASIDLGDSGATFTPSVDKDGNLSWTNDKNLTNPETVNIKGPKGDTPVKGTDYFTDTDKSEIINSVIEALPKYAGGVS